MDAFEEWDRAFVIKLFAGKADGEVHKNYKQFYLMQEYYLKQNGLYREDQVRGILIECVRFVDI